MDFRKDVLVRGAISSSAASEHYPYNPTAPFRHPEGWTAFNSALNVGLAYAMAPDLLDSADHSINDARD
ncbi:hypothetical protein Pan181_34390 [Aeoliella mucimassa]|uniref:Uncharacterized protein n=1 Tax=Aeoliella mucimassa TaxID=2527972 RepID=A0A518AR97_9BACT|nr:hypothetical protein Pan181_34390 [Aeoliella mucimassa]